MGCYKYQVGIMLGLGVREREIKSTIENFWEATTLVLKYVLYNEPVDGTQREKSLSTSRVLLTFSNHPSIFVLCRLNRALSQMFCEKNVKTKTVFVIELMYRETNTRLSTYQF